MIISKLLDFIVFISNMIAKGSLYLFLFILSSSFKIMKILFSTVTKILIYVFIIVVSVYVIYNFVI